MKTLFLSLFAVLTLASLQTFADWNRGVLQGASGKVIRYEQYATKTKGPVLLFLPGIYRGQMSSDEFTQNLVRSKISFVYMHFAEQPDSVTATLKDAKLDFTKVTTSTLAQEVKAVADQLNLENVIPVTLSYSAVLTQNLDTDRFPVVIEIAPIAKQLDDQPQQIVQFYEFWQSWVKAMPYGPDWLLATKRVQLHQYWANWLQNYKQRLPQLNDPEYFERAVQGYTSLTLAADDFDLRNQNFKKGPARYFILGENEEPFRSSVQKEAILDYQRQTGHTDNVTVIPGAGHIVMGDQPAEFVNALKEILKSLK